METKKKEKERLEREKQEREAAEAIEKQKQLEAEMKLRAAQLLQSGKIIAFYDKAVFSYHQDQKLLREWAVFTACTNLPDFKLNEINSYMTNWEVNLHNPTLQDVFAFSPEILQLIEELKEFLLLPLQTVSVETIKQIGLIYHEFKEKQQEYLDRSTYDILRDLTKYFDPEQGIFDMTASIDAITFSIYGNIFAQPELITHEYESLKFKFKIPECIVEQRGIYRLLKTEYDHYSDSTNSFFAPGVNNALKRSIEDWERKKGESYIQQEELSSPEPSEDEEKEEDIKKGSGSAEKKTGQLRKSQSIKGSNGRGGADSDDNNLDSQYKKLAKDLQDLEVMSRPTRGRGRKKVKRKGKTVESSETEAEVEAERSKSKGESKKTSVDKREEANKKKTGEEQPVRESVEVDEKGPEDSKNEDGRSASKQKGSGSESDGEKSKSKSPSRGRSKEKAEKEKSVSGSKSKSTSKSRGRSQSKKKEPRSSSKEKKVKKKSKSQERQKTEAELAKERERTEKAQFIPKLIRYELNLRNYTILGGIFHFNWIEIPPQPKDRGRWMLHLIEPDQTLEELIFQADYVPPTQEMQEAKKTPEEMEREAKKQEEELQKLVLLDMKVPRTALWFEPPIPVLWDHKKRIWSTDGFYDIRFNEDQLHLTLRTAKFGIIGLGHNRFSNLPYQSFELKPAGKDKCVFSLMAAMTAIEFTFENELVCVSSLQNVSNSDVVEAAIINKYMRPRQLIKALRYHGLDVFPELDSYAYVDGVLLKHIKTEEHMYQCMAVLSPSYNFHWSRWNLLAGRERMVFQMRERLGTTTPGNYSMILNTPHKCSLIACTEVSPNFSEEPVENSQYHADLLHLAMTIASDEAKTVIKEGSPHFIETIRILVTAVRPVSFS